MDNCTLVDEEKVCNTPECKGVDSDGRPFCSKCRKRKQKAKNPFRYFFNISKQNAKAREKEWTISFEEYVKIWTYSGHWEDRLNNPCEWTLDRRDAEEGYSFDNVKVVTAPVNSRKWHAYDKHVRCGDIPQGTWDSSSDFLYESLSVHDDETVLGNEEEDEILPF